MTVRDLIVLGTSSQHPTRYRNHGAYLFRMLNEGFLFDPGEGTQRQFIFAEVSPTTVTRIFISHFHGDHCLGLGSMLMRLNLDNVNHKIKCYYPSSGKKFFRRLRFGTICRFNIDIEEIPVSEEGIVDESGDFVIEAYFLNHGVDCIGWRITEKRIRKFNSEKIKALDLKGEDIKNIRNSIPVEKNGSLVKIDDISKYVKGDTISVILDTRLCKNVDKIAKNASLLLCESTYRAHEKTMARKYMHLTSEDAANIAKKGDVKLLVLTHFSARHLNEKDFKDEASKIFSNVIAARDFMKIKIMKSR